MKMMRDLTFVALLLGAGAPALAQQCAREEQVGWIGIAGLQCSNCRMGPETNVFSTEPRITAVAPGSPASGVLRAGDVIVSVNGVLITTTEGGDRLANVKPGQNLAMVVRRDGELITARLGTLPGRCRGDIASAAPAMAAARAGARGGGVRAGGAGQATTAIVAGGRAPTAIYTPTGELQAVTAMPLYSQLPRANFGFGITCPASDCTIGAARPYFTADEPVIWDFKSPPEVYSVETNSPAWRAGLRRGDVLTHIDGVSLTTDDGGRRFGSVRPGQTVRFTYRRGGAVRTATMRSEAARMTQDTEESIRRARELLSELSRQEREQSAMLERSLRELREADQRLSREAVAQLSREQAEQEKRLTELQAALARAATSARADGRATGLPLRAMPSVSVTADAITTSANTIRYSGNIGNADIEVRGGRSVSVNESEDEIIITVGDAVIRIKKR